MTRRPRSGAARLHAAVGFGSGLLVGAFLMGLLTIPPRDRDDSAHEAVSRSESDVPIEFDQPVIEASNPAVERPLTLRPTDARRAVDVRPIDRTPPAPAVVPPAGVSGAFSRRLRLPVEGLDRGDLVPSFADARSGGRRHEAIDILASRGTPVLAVEDGTIAKLFFSQAGGLTIYQFDPTTNWVYYYAHLDKYASGLSDGDRVAAGQILGYVGTTGNAPPGTPHLHFAIMRLTAEKRWWEGDAVDPYPILRGSS